MNWRYVQWALDLADLERIAAAFATSTDPVELRLRAAALFAIQALTELPDPTPLHESAARQSLTLTPNTRTGDHQQ